MPNDSVPTTGSAYNMAMLMLPIGQVLLTFSQDPGQAALYTPAGTPQPAWRPVIHKVPRQVKTGSTIQISGRRFNGLSQCSVYGDDVAVSTNYPIARALLRNGRVRYLRTHDHSTMGVATGAQEVTTHVDIPADLPTGRVTLQIVANGDREHWDDCQRRQGLIPERFSVRAAWNHAMLSGRAGAPRPGQRRFHTTIRKSPSAVSQRSAIGTTERELDRYVATHDGSSFDLGRSPVTLPPGADEPGGTAVSSKFYEPRDNLAQAGAGRQPHLGRSSEVSVALGVSGSLALALVLDQSGRREAVCSGSI